MGYDTSSWDERTRTIAEADGETAAIDDLIDRLTVARDALEQIHADGFAGPSIDDLGMVARIKHLERENADLRAQLEMLRGDAWAVAAACDAALVREQLLCAQLEAKGAHLSLTKTARDDYAEIAVEKQRTIDALRAQLEQERQAVTEARQAFIELWDSERSTNKKSWNYWARRFSWLPRIK